MGAERKMFHHLLEQDIQAIDSPELERAFVEIAGGTVNLIWRQEWHDWFHYLLPRAIPRSHEHLTVSYLVESAITAFMSLYPHDMTPEPYRGFRDDILGTLADRKSTRLNSSH